MKQLTIICLLILIFSCDNKSLNIVNLNTDLPEIVPLIDAFNSSHTSLKIIINNSKESDIFIYRGQKNNLPLQGKDISYLFDKKLNKNIFYSEILEDSINTDGSCYVLPLTFNIEGLIYNKNNLSNNKNIEIETFIKDEDIKFSPFWDQEFIRWFYLSNIPQFSIDKFFFDEEVFNDSANLISKMNLKIKDSWDLDLFNEKYMHLSPERLIEKSYIDYYFYNISDYIKLDRQYYPNIKFSILTTNGLIPIKDEMIFVGINNQSKKTKDNDKILSWIFNNVNQTNFIESYQKQNNKKNLFIDELSTLKKITTDVIPSFYPELEGLIPKTDILTTPTDLPILWNSLKPEVFLPIFKDIQLTPENLWGKKYMEYYNDWSKKHNK